MKISFLLIRKQIILEEIMGFFNYHVMRVTKETNELARKKVKDENTISYANI